MFVFNDLFIQLLWIKGGLSNINEDRSPFHIELACVSELYLIFETKNSLATKDPSGGCRSGFCG